MGSSETLKTCALECSDYLSFAIGSLKLLK